MEELVRPSAATSDLVHEWLAENGIDQANCSFSPAKDWVFLAMRVTAVEKLLNTRYSLYKHEDGNLLARIAEWSLPRHLHHHVRTIQPTTAFLKAASHDVLAKRDIVSIRVPGNLKLPPLPIIEDATGRLQLLSRNAHMPADTVPHGRLHSATA